MPNSNAPGGPPPSRRYTFPRSHRLKRRSLIRSLFDRSRDDVSTVTSGTIRLLSRLVDRDQTGYDVPVQVGFAPGRRTSNAVQRNQIRRQLRETYRRHQHLLSDLLEDRPEKTLIVMMLFRSDPAAHLSAIRQDLPRAMRKLSEFLQGSGNPA